MEPYHMSLHTEIWKIYEDDQLATYAFGPLKLFRKKYIGKVVIYKKTGDIHIVEHSDKSISKDKLKDFYLQRVKSVLNFHRAKGIYPDKTDAPTLRVGVSQKFEKVQLFTLVKRNVERKK